jgi:hypothetical protein
VLNSGAVLVRVVLLIVIKIKCLEMLFFASLLEKRARIVGLAILQRYFVLFS